MWFLEQDYPELSVMCGMSHPSKGSQLGRQNFIFNGRLPTYSLRSPGCFPMWVEIIHSVMPVTVGVLGAVGI